ncbi:MAG: cell division protein ZapE [Hydrogenophilus sp.]|nr:cell division protein ZapE [Hydrogenophilus sp.]
MWASVSRGNGAWGGEAEQIVHPAKGREEDAAAAVRAAFATAFARMGFVADASQVRAIERLARLAEALEAEERGEGEREGKGWWSQWVGRVRRGAEGIEKRNAQRGKGSGQGVYLWGGVGRGKSLLMDLFFTAAPVARKRRVHFHELMQEVHGRLTELRGRSDPLAVVAASIAQEARLLCLDEFHVNDVADAMILGRLLAGLGEEGVRLVMTSNYPPSGLYPNGLQRERFLPTIAWIEERCEVLEVEGGVDYRQVGEEGGGSRYWFPVTPEHEAALAACFEALTGEPARAGVMEVCGRALPFRGRAKGVVWFDFAPLVAEARSYLDYLEVAHHHSAVLLSGVPVLPPARAEAAQRLMWLVDVLYDRGVELYVTAEAPPALLYRSGRKGGEFARTVSRLEEWCVRGGRGRRG